LAGLCVHGRTGAGTVGLAPDWLLSSEGDPGRWCLRPMRRPLWSVCRLAAQIWAAHGLHLWAGRSLLRGAPLPGVPSGSLRFAVLVSVRRHSATTPAPAASAATNS